MTAKGFVKLADLQALHVAPAPRVLTQYDRGVRCGERLIGTPSSIEKEAEDGDEFESQEFLDGVDSVAFECNECGWWCEIGEATAGHDGSEDVCQDCAPDED